MALTDFDPKNPDFNDLVETDRTKVSSDVELLLWQLQELHQERVDVLQNIVESDCVLFGELGDSKVISVNTSDDPAFFAGVRFALDFLGSLPVPAKGDNSGG